MSSSSTDITHVDVLILTAVKQEQDALMDVNTGAWPDSEWERRKGPAALEVAFRKFRPRDGRPILVAASRALEMGGVAAATAAGPLLSAYRPDCLAMCGVCAGRRGHVALGDVILADRLWTYDSGKVQAEEDQGGQRVERFWHDVLTYNLHPAWRQLADSFQPVPREAEPWLSKRPRSYEFQQNWLLDRILAGDEKPYEHPEWQTHCADYPKVLERLWRDGAMEQDELRLTPKGLQQIKRLRTQHPTTLPEPEAFRVHVGPLATGNRVVEDRKIFDQLANVERKVLGLEMEASAIGTMAHLNQIPFMVVMKGVMDFADGEKNDQFKSFAARASAECLIAFIREHLPSSPSVMKPPVTGTHGNEPQPEIELEKARIASQQQIQIEDGRKQKRIAIERIRTRTWILCSLICAAGIVAVTYIGLQALIVVTMLLILVGASASRLSTLSSGTPKTGQPYGTAIAGSTWTPALASIGLVIVSAGAASSLRESKPVILEPLRTGPDVQQVPEGVDIEIKLSEPVDVDMDAGPMSADPATDADTPSMPRSDHAAPKTRKMRMGATSHLGRLPPEAINYSFLINDYRFRSCYFNSPYSLRHDDGIIIFSSRSAETARCRTYKSRSPHHS